jgi:hypothetical protein
VSASRGKGFGISIRAQTTYHKVRPISARITQTKNKTTSKKLMKTRRNNIARITLGFTTLLAIGVLYPALPARGSSATAPGNSSAFGNSLTVWQETWFRWYYGDITVPTDSNGNVVVGDHMVLFPIPLAPGDGTPAHLDVTLSAGQSFVLPLWAVLGTSYTDGTPPDPFVSDSVFQTLDISFTIDGVTVLDGSNVMNYYSKEPMDPIIPIFDFPPYKAIIWMQSVGITHAPLRPGKHTFSLHAVNTQPFFLGISDYNNTWTVTVLP